MKQINLAIVFCLILIFLGVAQLMRKSFVDPTTDAGPTGIPASDSAPAVLPSPPANNEGPAQASTPPPSETPAIYDTSAISAPEQKSLQDMAQVMSAYAKPESTPEALVELLKGANLSPQQNTQKNETLVTLGTPSAGLRRFEAQYLSDESGKKMAQRISFEFRPGPDALPAVMQLVQKNWGELGPPTEKKADFIQWMMPNGYILWLKQLGVRDLEASPQNKYTDADIGTVRVMLEKALHDDHDETDLEVPTPAGF